MGLRGVTRADHKGGHITQNAGGAPDHGPAPDARELMQARLAPDHGVVFDGDVAG